MDLKTKVRESIWMVKDDEQKMNQNQKKEKKNTQKNTINMMRINKESRYK